MELLIVFHLLGCPNKRQATLPSQMRFSTSFRGWLISAGVPCNIVVRIKPFLFRNRCNLKPGSSPDLGSTTSLDLELQPQSSTPHRVPQPNQTFDISQIPFQSGFRMQPLLAWKCLLPQLHKHPKSSGVCRNQK